MIEKIRIGHDNRGSNPGWHLDRVEIRRQLRKGKVVRSSYNRPAHCKDRKIVNATLFCPLMVQSQLTYFYFLAFETYNEAQIKAAFVLYGRVQRQPFSHASVGWPSLRMMVRR